MPYESECACQGDGNGACGHGERECSCHEGTHDHGHGNCACGSCDGGCRGSGDQEAAEAYRAAHAADAVPCRRDLSDPEAEHVIVVSFSSTFDVMEAERLCHDVGVPGRIRPLPAGVTADCGLAWVMPCSGDALAAFRSAIEGAVVPEDYRQLVL